MKHKPIQPYDIEQFKTKGASGASWYLSGVVQHFAENYGIHIDICYYLFNAYEIAGSNRNRKSGLSEREYCLYLAYCAKFIKGDQSLVTQDAILSIIKKNVAPGLTMKPNRYDKMVQSISLLILEE